MNAKKRYSLIFLTCLVCCSAFVVYRKSTRSWRGSVRLSSQLNGQPYSERKRPSFLDVNDEFSLHDNTGALKELENLQTSKCTMEACFDRTKCLDEFKIYVYPIQANEKISPLFGKMLKVLRESDFYTEDPNRACLFIPSIDTLDRDKLSDAYVHQVNAKVTSLPYWNDGRNHVIFNLFSGTWPDYKEDLSFNAGKAILAKASRSVELFRPGFDISFPLLPKSHPHKGRETANDAYSAVFPLERKYKLGFKGKRYLNGIGSESRNSLYHIHNGKDIILLTTCKHGQSWTKHKDERCDKDNEEYEKYDYDELLRNATFCLVPRGRRLGSYRFLESIQAGCIPVILSNGWQLPFSEVIDWTKALIQGDERLLTEVPSVVRSYSTDQILALKQQALFLWEAYFSSIEKVILTTLEVIHSRIAKNRAAIFPMWNTFPGALVSHPQYSRSPQDFPFYNIKLGMQVEDKFTAVIYSTTSIMKESSALSRLLKNVGQSKMVSKVVVLWMSDAPVTHNKKWPQINVPIVVVKPETKTANSRFVPRSVVDTSAVLSLDEDIKLNSDEIDFAFSVWRVFPDRIVGFPARNHHWDDSHSQWFYSSTWSNEYSMVLTSGAFYHKYYNFAYTNNLQPRIHRMVEHYGVCDDLAMNFLVADITRKPPIKVLPQTSLPNLFSRNTKYSKLMQLFEHRQKCMETLVDAFGYMPLVKSQVRMDPLLYRDPVSNLRKRYRLLEV